ncbi:hypothetical protein B0H14DRAFT_2647692 [Mycena olivaceomarginata]|nr:hypothetical protein B0H14DRAFT_2647692 [Mycena olivaceomarginata]
MGCSFMELITPVISTLKSAKLPTLENENQTEDTQNASPNSSNSATAASGSGSTVHAELHTVNTSRFSTIDGFAGFSALMTSSRHSGLRSGLPAAVLKNKGRPNLGCLKDKVTVPCWPDPRVVPTKATHWPDEDDVQVGFSADKGDVRAAFVLTKTTGGWASMRQRRYADKDSTHKARWGSQLGVPGGAWNGRVAGRCVTCAGRGMGAWRAAARRPRRQHAGTSTDLTTRLSRMSPEFYGSGDLWNSLGVQWIPKNIRPFGFQWAGL